MRNDYIARSGSIMASDEGIITDASVSDSDTLIRVSGWEAIIDLPVATASTAVELVMSIEDSGIMEDPGKSTRERKREKAPSREELVRRMMAVQGAWEDRTDLPDDPVAHLWSGAGEYLERLHGESADPD